MNTMTESAPVPHTVLPWEGKSTLEEIRTRFDNDVERFSSLETGQQATIDAPLVLDLVAQTAVQRLRPDSDILDLGCGAGNFSLRVLQEVRAKAAGAYNPLPEASNQAPDGPATLNCHLTDLSRPMLNRAESRLRQAGAASITTYPSDLRRLHFAENSFCCILAGAVLHHLRDDDDWTDVFAKLHRWLRPGGRLYVSDMVTFDAPDLQKVMWRRYGEYLESLGGVPYREKVFAYIEKEDSPRSLPYQLDLVRRSGFTSSDVLHRNSIFACYCATK
jgi:tRNA (cmo5U34)-methyltransferase